MALVLVMGGCGDDTVTPPPDLPPGPVSLAVEQAKALSVRLQWERSTAADFQRYELWRTGGLGGIDADSLFLATVEDPDAVMLEDASVGPRSRYRFFVRVVDAGEQSSEVTSVDVETPAPASPMVGLGPRFRRLPVGQIATARVWVDGAPGLAAFAGVVRVSEQLELLECLAGDFPPVRRLFLCQPDEGGPSLAVLGQDPEGHGFGTVVEFRFRAAAPGLASLGWSREPRLEDSEGRPLLEQSPELILATWEVISP